LISGAFKPGTTSLHYYLNEHPQVSTTDQKELRSFDQTTNYSEGAEHYRTSLMTERQNIEGKRLHHIDIWYHI
jgi:hypothetical protein